VQRSVNGPASDWLTVEEAAAYMRMHPSTLKRLIKDGRFPQGSQAAGRQRLWGWMDCVAYMHLASRLVMSLPPGADDDDE
jgi:excisionase family DNA binding protein